VIAKLFRFGVVGVLTALLQFSLLFLGVEILQVNSTLASCLAYVIVVIFNYLMHYSWTFQGEAPHGRTLRRYLLMVACGFLLNAVFMYVGTGLMSINYLLVQSLAMAIVILWNFVVSNLWVFRN
jgi:putative flippase GtrA